MDFTDRRALVTGGSRGIGRAVARLLAERGARVAINYRSDGDSAAETAASLAGTGHTTLQADVGEPDQAQRLVDEAATALGGLDIVVNNAGVAIGHRIEDVDFERWQAAWRDTLAANLIGPANVCYCAARHMMAHGGGRIVNVSSRGAFRGEPQMPAYGASKAGLNAMSQSLAQKLAPWNIFVGVVAPGFVETDMARPYLDGPEGDAIRAQSPLGRVARPEEVAWAVLFLASEQARFSTGAIIDVNGASYLRS